MADAKTIQLLDEKLIEGNLIDNSYKEDYKKVHRFLNSHIHKRGSSLPLETFEVVEKLLRNWLDTLYKQGASQEKLTSYLRCGLAHMSFDYIDSTYEQIGREDLVTRAMISFKQRHYNRTFYRPPATPSSKKTGVATSKKKTTSKIVKAIKRETSGKKISKKKTVTKKVTKKKVVKKQVSKKKIGKKKSSKK